MAEFVISVKRNRRLSVDQGWKAALSSISGVKVLGADHPYSVQVQATETAANKIVQLYSGLCHVNPVRYRQPL